MTPDQPLLCPLCQGVLLATHSSAYTPARSRLILTNGYCRGHRAEARPAPAPEQQPAPPAPVPSAPVPSGTVPVHRPTRVVAS
ncbi:hypothetical protein [Nonomuraea sp. NPDC050783]|uniref:hypothetical protein n=1 Tax=Nonomuraea sp. NPDC050783 TaxID=3154634 RepID=UPI0034658445